MWNIEIKEPKEKMKLPRKTKKNYLIIHIPTYSLSFKMKKTIQRLTCSWQKKSQD